MRNPVDYSANYFSYSAGANYRLTDALAVFARHSRGGRVNADRLLFGDSVDTTTGKLRPGSTPVNFVVQTEAGVKYRQGPATLNVTGFLASANEQNFDPTQAVGNQFVDRRYRSYGVEVEGAVTFGEFQLSGNGTWTNSRIRNDRLNPGNVGNIPNRQADFVWSITPQYRADRFGFGANLIGTTGSYTQNNNQLRLPGFVQTNLFVTVSPIERVHLSVNANNLFDVYGFTEAEEGSIPASGFVRARSINGRTISASARFDF